MDMHIPQALFQNISVTEKEKQQLELIYVISTYKTLIELMLSLKAQDEQFVKKFQEQIKTLIESLSKEEQEALSTGMKKEQDIAMTDLLTMIGKSLTEVDRKQFLANIESLKTSV